MMNKMGIRKALSLAWKISINRRHAIRVSVEHRASYTYSDFGGVGPTLEDVLALVALSTSGIVTHGYST